MKFKTILFDFDGVWVLSEPIHFKPWQKIFKNTNL